MRGKILTLTIRPPRKSIPTETRHLAQKRCRIDAKMWPPEAGKKSYKNKNKKITQIWPSHFTPLPGRPCGADFYHFWLVGSHRRRNHPCQILSRLVKGLGGYGYPKSGVSHWLWMSLLQQCYALTCYTVSRSLQLILLWYPPPLLLYHPPKHCSPYNLTFFSVHS